jgi:hypothetical protein
MYKIVEFTDTTKTSLGQYGIEMPDGKFLGRDGMHVAYFNSFTSCRDVVEHLNFVKFNIFAPIYFEHRKIVKSLISSEEIANPF